MRFHSCFVSYEVDSSQHSSIAALHRFFPLEVTRHDDGRHIWDFLRTEDELTACPSSNSDKYWLGHPLVSLYLVVKPSSTEFDWCIEFPGTPKGEESAGRCPQRIHVLPKNSNKRGSLGG